MCFCFPGNVSESAKGAMNQLSCLEIQSLDLQLSVLRFLQYWERFKYEYVFFKMTLYFFFYFNCSVSVLSVEEAASMITPKIDATSFCFFLLLGVATVDHLVLLIDLGLDTTRAGSGTTRREALDQLVVGGQYGVQRPVQKTHDKF